MGIYNFIVNDVQLRNADIQFRPFEHTFRTEIVNVYEMFLLTEFFAQFNVEPTIFFTPTLI